MNEDMNKDMQMREGQEQQAPEMPHEEMPNTLQDNAPDKKSSGPLIGIIIIIVVLLVGGLYFWMTKIATIPEETGTDTEAVVEQLSTQSASDEISAIEADLDATDLENLDAELDSLLNEF